jgi:hypothetical protein
MTDKPTLPVIISVPEGQMELAQSITAQILEQFRTTSGVLFLPEALTPRTAIVEDDMHRQSVDTDILDAQREADEAVAAGRPVPIRPGVPTAPPLSQVGTPNEIDIAVLGYTQHRVREALFVAAGILKSRSQDRPTINDDYVIVQTIANRA